MNFTGALATVVAGKDVMLARGRGTLVGVASIGSSGDLGRLGGKTIVPPLPTRRIAQFEDPEGNEFCVA